MNKKDIICGIGIFILIVIGGLSIRFLGKEDTIKTNTNTIEATVLAVENGQMTVQDKDSVIYTFHTKEQLPDVGENVVIEYTGLLDKNKSVQGNQFIGYKTTKVSLDDNGTPTSLLDDGIFSGYYALANNKLKELSLDEKIGQLFLVRYPEQNAIKDLKQYQFGGYVFFERDFKNQTTSSVQNMMQELQKNAKVPLLTAVDEEGGKVVRVSSNPNLVSEKFKSSRELYQEGGFDLIKQDTIKKSEVLKNLGLNLNLAPVVDVSTNPSDYMYQRALGENTELTSTYAKTVINASHGTGVSYTLKHFPGYGNNNDTHTGSVIDNRPYDDIIDNDLPPFKAGIDALAEAVLVSHNTVTSIDPNNPASLSPSVHNLLRNELDFTGIIMTDDIEMGATASIDNVAVKALLAGNDLIITTDYQKSINEIKTALQNGTISESLIDRAAFRVLAWKYYKGLMFEIQK